MADVTREDLTALGVPDSMLDKAKSISLGWPRLADMLTGTMEAFLGGLPGIGSGGTPTPATTNQAIRKMGASVKLQQLMEVHANWGMYLPTILELTQAVLDAVVKEAQKNAAAKTPAEAEKAADKPAEKTTDKPAEKAAVPSHASTHAPAHGHGHGHSK
jgi:hypothetical protein